MISGGTGRSEHQPRRGGSGRRLFERDRLGSPSAIQPRCTPTCRRTTQGPWSSRTSGRRSTLRRWWKPGGPRRTCTTVRYTTIEQLLAEGKHGLARQASRRGTRRSRPIRPVAWPARLALRQFFAVVTVVSNVVVFLGAVLDGGGLALASLFGWNLWPSIAVLVRRGGQLGDLRRAFHDGARRPLVHKRRHLMGSVGARGLGADGSFFAAGILIAA